MGNLQGRSRRRKGHSVAQKAAALRNRKQREAEEEEAPNNEGASGSTHGDADGGIPLEQQLADAKTRISELEEALSVAHTKLDRAESNALAQEQRMTALKTKLDEARCQRTYAQRRDERAKLANTKLRGKLKAIPELQKTISKQDTELQRTLQRLSSTETVAVMTINSDRVQYGQLIVAEREKVREQSDRLRECQRTIRNLQRRCDRAPLVLAKAVEKAKKRPITYKLLHKGAYTPEARGLARLLVKNGCRQRAVGRVIQEMAKVLGITVQDHMSSRTVRRALDEGNAAMNQVDAGASEIDQVLDGEPSADNQVVLARRNPANGQAVLDTENLANNQVVFDGGFAAYAGQLGVEGGASEQVIPESVLPSADARLMFEGWLSANNQLVLGGGIAADSHLGYALPHA